MIFFDDSNPVGNVVLLDLFTGGQGTRRDSLCKVELVQETGVTSRSGEQSLLGKLGVIDMGVDFDKLKGRHFSVEHVKDGLISSFGGLDQSRNHRAALAIVSAENAIVVLFQKRLDVFFRI